MKVISINVGLPRVIVHEGRMVRTAIFKYPAGRRIRVNALNLAGDGQADLTVHGGPSKALYLYPAEHYEFWRREFPGMNLPWGTFGENLTTEGLTEKGIAVGDRLCVSTVELTVTEPRLPCYKLGIKFGRADIVKRFLQSRRTGFYCAVSREGDIGAGDAIHVLSQETVRLAIADFTRLYAFAKSDLDTMRRAVEIKALPDGWRQFFRNRIQTISQQRNGM